MTRVSGADERAHVPPDAASWWWETWDLDVATDDGIGLAVRLACIPPLGIAWWWTHLLLPDLPGPVVVRDHEVGLPRQGLEIRADGLWAELTCETPFDHWSYGLEAFGVRLDHPSDSLRGEIGERVPVGLDIEWDVSSANEPFEYGAVRADGYEQFGVVHGEVLLGRSRFELDAVGLRSHAWGGPRFDRSARSMWMHSPALAVSVASVDGHEPEGVVHRPGAPDEPISEDGYATNGETLASFMVPLAGPQREPAVLVRELCRFDASGEPGIGWSSRLDRSV